MAGLACPSRPAPDATARPYPGATGHGRDGREATPPEVAQLMDLADHPATGPGGGDDELADLRRHGPTGRHQNQHTRSTITTAAIPAAVDGKFARWAERPRPQPRADRRNTSGPAIRAASGGRHRVRARSHRRMPHPADHATPTGGVAGDQQPHSCARCHAERCGSIANGIQVAAGRSRNRAADHQAGAREDHRCRIGHCDPNTAGTNAVAEQRHRRRPVRQRPGHQRSIMGQAGSSAASSWPWRDS